ncbi:hypothetical protein KRONOS_194 [Vibrio phage Kronos]|uniref:Uncharacterized protein n=1 Tax=Vibrio phage Bennett TaxID=2735171 RepID=A0A6M4ESD1_9CAUD|nr:hypothetical protein KNU87_gp117 [Vibrio phage Bennett]QJQ85205.1 hypothetical protein BENNETT_193 [Vibrio phage Bennett]QKE61028.1 hypothetical protein DAX_191 [Vibrio phage Dax]QKN84637.1 hypothetical protein BBMUFFIN_193 [Vibrio phage BBMuffin]WBU76977.1 hypothetical protein KRONOS_194 [Vibrio phage Kronos]
MNKKLIVLTVVTLITLPVLITSLVHTTRAGISLELGLEAGKALCEGTTTKKTIAKRLNDWEGLISKEEFLKGYNDVSCSEQEENLKEIEGQL